MVPEGKGLDLLIPQQGVPGISTNNDGSWRIYWSSELMYVLVADQRKTAACHRVIPVLLGNAQRSISYATLQVYHWLGNLSILTLWETMLHLPIY